MQDKDSRHGLVINGKTNCFCSHCHNVYEIRRRQVNSEQNTMSNPVIEAAKNGDCPSLRRQVNTHGAWSVNTRCVTDGTTPLYWAACNGHLVACDWLVRHGADVNLRVEKSGSTPLHGAADRGHLKCVVLLLGSGSRVDAQTTSNGDTALHLAAYRGHLDICRILVERGADTTILNHQHRTPVEDAQTKGNYEVFQLLHRYREGAMKSSYSSQTDQLYRYRREPVEHEEVGKLISEPLIRPPNSSSADSKTSDAKCPWSARDECDEPQRGQVPTIPSVPTFTSSNAERHTSPQTSRTIPDVDISTSTSPRQTSLAPASTDRDRLIRGLEKKITELETYAESLQLALTVRDDRVAVMTRQNAALRDELAAANQRNARLLEQLAERNCALNGRTELERPRCTRGGCGNGGGEVERWLNNSSNSCIESPCDSGFQMFRQFGLEAPLCADILTQHNIM